MSYKLALEAAGFTVHRIKYFGSWSGQWVAYVTDPEGNQGFIQDWYGSCSVCDAFEADVGWEPWDDAEEDEKEQYNRKVKEFGTRYYNTLLTEEQLWKVFDTSWDATDADLAAFIEG